MKRLHVHVGVNDLATSIGFYSTLFGSAPSVVKPDYAKWMLDDPRVNFAISVGRDDPGVSHLGIQTETADELAEVSQRLDTAVWPILAEGTTTCCYAMSEKSWTRDPDGVVWEAFHTTGEATTYGTSPALGSLVPAGQVQRPAEPIAATESSCCG
jgi:catechol 2,3-dioxygenase-like lactoylglutathione lyase family enzyme